MVKTTRFYETVGFQAVFGVIPGYNENYYTNIMTVTGWTTEEISAVENLSTAWMEAMYAEHSKSGIMVVAITNISRALYPGAPPRVGEIACTVTGHCISQFLPKNFSVRDYKEAVTRVVNAVRIDLKQERVQLAFHPISEIVYLEPREDDEQGNSNSIHDSD